MVVVPDQCSGPPVWDQVYSLNNGLRGRAPELLQINTMTSWSFSPNYMHIIRVQSVHAPSQWETTLLCNVVSHWLGAYSKWWTTAIIHECYDVLASLVNLNISLLSRPLGDRLNCHIHWKGMLHSNILSVLYYCYIFFPYFIKHCIFLTLSLTTLCVCDARVSGLRIVVIFLLFLNGLPVTSHRVVRQRQDL